MEKTTNRSAEEIDLVMMFKQTGLALKNAGDKLLRHIIVFLAITAIGVAAAFLIRKSTPVIFETEGVYITKTLPYMYCAEKIRQLNNNISNDPKTASALLQLTPVKVGSIEKIDLLPSEPTVYSGPWDSSALPLKFRLSVKNTTLIGEIEKAIPLLLEGTDFAVRQMEARSVRLNTSLNGLETAIRDIEQMQQKILETSAGDNRDLQLSGLQQLKLQYSIEQDEIKKEGPAITSLMVPFSRSPVSNTASRDKKYHATILGSVFVAVAVILVFFPAKKRSL